MIAVAILLGGALGPASETARGGTLNVTGGSLILDLDGAAIANGADAAYLASFGVELTPGQTFMEFARHFASPEAAGLSVFGFRPQPNPPVVNFNDIRAGWVRPSSNGLVNDINSRNPIGAQPAGRGAVPTTFSFDSVDIVGTAAGVIGTNGATSFWYSNQAMIDTGSVWLAFGDLILQYDPSRFVSGGNSGWYISNNLLFPQTLFDTRNVTVGYSDGVLTVGGDLFVSQEFRDAWAIQEGLEVGSFQLTANTVPEPSTTALFAAGCALFLLASRGRRRAQRE